MKLLIGADLVPTDTNQDLFTAGDERTLVGEELLTVLQSADYRVFNLETPLTDFATTIDKNGPALIAPTETIAGYKALGVDCVTIANNHIMDQGVEGLHSTLQILDQKGIAHLGAGEHLEDAAKPHIIELDGKKIGFYACAEHEFSIAGENTPGANPFDPLESPDHVAALKQQCDFVVVLYHGGKEHYRYPSPQLRKTCRKLVQKGADLVLCQHSHCIGCEEKYLEGTIVYGQGNFLFDHSKSEFWQTSLLVQVNGELEVSYIPVCKRENVARLAQGQEAQQILADFSIRSGEILEPGFVEESYAAFARQMRQQYLIAFGGKESRLFRLCNKLAGNRLRTWRHSKRYDKKKLLSISNYVRCEAHRELLLQALQIDEE